RGSPAYIFQRGDLSVSAEALPWERGMGRQFADDFVDREEGDIMRARLLGEKQYIDETTRDAFMRTGTVHLLAVSGLHVMVIALVLFALLSWIPNRMAQLVIYSLLLSFYALMAGAGLSIARAVIV